MSHKLYIIRPLEGDGHKLVWVDSGDKVDVYHIANRVADELGWDYYVVEYESGGVTRVMFRVVPDRDDDAEIREAVNSYLESEHQERMHHSRYAYLRRVGRNKKKGGMK